MRHAAALVSTLLLAAFIRAGEAPRIANARLETRPAAAGLAAAVKQASSRPGPLWIGWSVPSILEQSSCCWSSEDGSSCRGCRLEGGNGWAGTSDDDSVRLEGGGFVRVLLRAAGGSVAKVRSFSADCPLDGGGLPLVWIEDVRPAESVALLASLVGQPRDDRSRKSLDDGVVSAIAFHADPSADAALERFVAAGQPDKLRKQAAFWLGQVRGKRGYEVLRRLVRDDADARFREHAVFALTQSREPGAVDTIIEVARRDPDGHVRGQALFWLAQAASRQAAGTIRAAVDDDPEVGVKKTAVFALSQLPREEGVPLLIGVAKSHQSAEVRKQAMFWLGQSGDPRALAFFEDVLRR
jgi:hypothetical protein